MSASPSEIRAWALESGFDLPSKGRLPDDVLHAYEAAHLPGEAADVSAPGEAPELAADPEPARARGGKAARGRAAKAAKVSDAVRKDIRGKTALALSMAAASFSVRDPVCGPVAVEIVPDTADALADIFCESPDLVAWFTATGGGYMLWIKLAVAVQPLLTVAWRHHIARSAGTEGGGPGGWDGETVPPDMSHYHAPAL
jgi:hypothetical protein